MTADANKTAEARAAEVEWRDATYSAKIERTLTDACGARFKQVAYLTIFAASATWSIWLAEPEDDAAHWLVMDDPLTHSGSSASVDDAKRDAVAAAHKILDGMAELFARTNVRAGPRGQHIM